MVPFTSTRYWSLHSRIRSKGSTRCIALVVAEKARVRWRIGVETRSCRQLRPTTGAIHVYEESVAVEAIAEKFADFSIRTHQNEPSEAIGFTGEVTSLTYAPSTNSNVYSFPNSVPVNDMTSVWQYWLKAHRTVNTSNQRKPLKDKPSILAARRNIWRCGGKTKNIASNS